MSNTTSISLIDHSLPVLVGQKGNQTAMDITVLVADVSIPLFVGSNNAEVFIRAIEDTDGFVRAVFIDTYRNLVQRNYSSFQGVRGKEGARLAEKEGYGDQHTLPSFQPKSEVFNAPGMIVWNMLRYPSADQIGYRILGTILTRLIETEFFDKPRLKSLPQAVFLHYSGPAYQTVASSSLAVQNYVEEKTTQIESASNKTSEQSESSIILSDDQGDEKSEYIPSEEEAVERVRRDIKKRRGQHAFREQMINQFRGRCVVTGCELRAVLEAAHIVPHRAEADNHDQNGLLLRTDIHTLFDLNMVGIEPTKGTIHLHPILRTAKDYRQYEGNVAFGVVRRASETALKWRWAQFQKRLQPS